MPGRPATVPQLQDLPAPGLQYRPPTPAPPRARLPAQPSNLALPWFLTTLTTLRRRGRVVRNPKPQAEETGAPPKTRTTKREGGHAHNTLLLATLLTPAASNDDSPIVNHPGPADGPASVIRTAPPNPGYCGGPAPSRSGSLFAVARPMLSATEDSLFGGYAPSDPGRPNSANRQHGTGERSSTPTP